ncbi:glycosyl transferase family 1 [Vibrio metoecus]|nr:glycosyl transferase family 1 [Vibrio metoecus]PAR44252.1 glycosyl transferase family 1 [Vibrio metoecus]
MNMTKLAIVRQKYRPDGGAEKFVASALTALRETESIDLTVITRQWQGELDPHYHVLRCDPFKWGRVSRERGFAKQAQALFADFDLVQSHERIPGCDIFRAGDGVHRCWLEHKSRIQTPAQAKAMQRSRFHRYIINAEQAMFDHHNLKAVICNSNLVKREICQHFSLNPERIHVIYNAVDTKQFHPDLRRYRLPIRQQLAIPDSAPVMLYVGSGFERKGVAAAIEAIAQTHAHLLIIGQDKQEKRYRTQAKNLGCQERIHFLGLQKQPAAYYGAADGFLFPTLYDPFPNVVLEAMAAGLGVITSTTCGASDIIRHGENGFVTDALDIEAIAQAIRSLSDSQMSLEIGQQARITVEPFTASRLAEQLNTLYQHLLQQYQS